LYDLSDAEYEDQLRIHLKEAVGARLRVKEAIFSELSGGLDSSSIVLTADDVLRSEHRDTASLHTLSTIYDTSITCDEQYFISIIEKQRGIESTYVTENEQQITLGLNNIEFTGFPNILDCAPGRLRCFVKHMTHSGARVLLTGIGGDHIFGSTPYPEALVADLLIKGQLIAAHRCCSVWSHLGAVTYANLLFGKSVPLALSHYYPLSHSYDVLHVPHWLDLSSHSAITSELKLVVQHSRLLPSQRLTIGTVQALFRLTSRGLWNAWPYLYVSHPYTHRPLVEFCLAIPLSQLMRNGETRSLLRRALAGTLPEATAKRKGKGNVFEAVARAVQRDWADIGDIQNWLVSQCGYVRPKELYSTLLSLRAGVNTSGATSVLHVVVLERFLRSLAMIERDNTALDAVTLCS
jgi:asparagine synthase (glutamine-hydrolysing)